MCQNERILCMRHSTEEIDRLIRSTANRDSEQKKKTCKIVLEEKKQQMVNHNKALDYCKHFLIGV